MCSGHGDRLVEHLEVRSNDRLTEGVGLVTFDAPMIAERVSPGQFVHVRIAEGADFILRRPFSVHRAGEGRIEILYQTLGRGTRALSRAEPGDRMDAVGPLGSGWEIPSETDSALLVAGGLGVAPFGMLVGELADRGIVSSVALGAPTQSRLLARDHLESHARRVVTATDDGSHGVKGFVTELSAVLLGSVGFDVVYVCGPEAMCRTVAAQAHDAGIPCQVSLERLMACGVGACLSCVVSTRDGLKKACVEGPVFDAGSVVWDPTETPPRH